MKQIDSLIEACEKLVSCKDEILRIARSQGGSSTKMNHIARHLDVDLDRRLESDLIRWILMCPIHQSRFIYLAYKNLTSEMFRIPICRRAYEAILNLNCQGKDCDLLSVAIELKDSKGQHLLAEIMRGGINLDGAEKFFKETIQRILDREWFKERETIKMKITSGNGSDDQVKNWLYQYDQLKRTGRVLMREDL